MASALYNEKCMEILKKPWKSIVRETCMQTVHYQAGGSPFSPVVFDLVNYNPDSPTIIIEWDIDSSHSSSSLVLHSYFVHQRLNMNAGHSLVL